MGICCKDSPPIEKPPFIPPYQNNNNYIPNNYKNNNNNNNVNTPPQIYDYNLYKKKYMAKKKNNDINNLNKEYNNIKINNRIFYDDIEVQKQYLANYSAFVAELNYQLNDLNDQLNINLIEQEYNQYIQKEENKDLLNDLENITFRINEFKYLIKKQKHELKNLENNFKIIQEQFNDINENEQDLIPIKLNYIKQNLDEISNIVNKLNENKILYEQKKKEIENYIEIIQSMTKVKINQIKVKRKETIKIHVKKKHKYNNNNYNNYNNLSDSLFLKGSMLLGIKDFGNAKNIFKSMYLFKDSQNENNFNEQKLLRKNWHQICYINEEYDLHEINYELKAVGIPKGMNFTSSSLGFVLDTNNEILLFEVDGIKKDYIYEKYSLSFKVKLQNLETSKIHLIYKQSPIIEKMSEDEIALRKIYRSKYYGISGRLVGQKAKYILKNESNFEIINFDEEFFVKMGENEYQWGGVVPEGGKETVVRLSKKEGKIFFTEKHVFKSINNSYITNTTTQIPLCYMGGNNQIIKFNYYSEQTERINIDQNQKVFNIQYLNTNSPIGEFTITGELINRCKGDWIINLTNEEIDSLIPDEFKKYKDNFKIISNSIIKSYDKEHKHDLITVPTVTKIGKWIKKNIKYDITYVGLNDIGALETYNNRRGVCHHMTKLLNALMYSLGYQVLYVLGYAMDKKSKFGIEDAHAWSLIKIEGKWLPFDPTWGIFSGKLPITHIFKQTDCKGIKTLSYDKVKIEQIKVVGNII